MDIIKWILFVFSALAPVIWCGMYCNNNEKTFIKNGLIIIIAILIALLIFFMLNKKKILTL